MKIKFAAVVVVFVVFLVAMRSCQTGGSAEQSSSALPDVVSGTVEIPICSSEVGSEVTRTEVLRGIGTPISAYEIVQACVGLTQSELSKLKRVGAVGVPADDDVVLVAISLQSNRFRVCGMADDVVASDQIPAVAVTCQS